MELTARSEVQELRFRGRAARVSNGLRIDSNLFVRLALTSKPLPVEDSPELPEVTEESVSRFLSGSTLADGKVVGIVNVRGVLDALESGDA